MFVSVANEDLVFGEALKDLLESRPSANRSKYWTVFCYSRDIGPVNWRDRISKAIQEIQNRDYFVIIATENWVKSVECRNEHAVALATGKHVLSFRPTAESPVDGSSLLEPLNQVPLFHVPRSGDSDERTIRVNTPTGQTMFRLTDEAAKRFGEIADADEFALPEDMPLGSVDYPYVGMTRLDVNEAGIFFGRNKEIDRAIRDIKHMTERTPSGLFYIHGPSGVGKSSFMRAGIISRLNRARQDFVVLDIYTPSQSPMTQFRAWMREVVRRYPFTEYKVDTILDTPPEETAELIRRYCDREARELKLAEGRPILIPLDQGEELIFEAAGKPGKPRHEVEQFVKWATGFLGARRGIHFLATVREEYSAELISRLHTAEPTSFPLQYMRDAFLEEVVRGPISRSELGHKVLSDQLISQLVADTIKLKRPESRLPLLAFALERLHTNGVPDEKGVVELPETYVGLEAALDDAVARACDNLSPGYSLDPSKELRLKEELREFFFSYFLQPAEPHDGDAGSARVRFKPCPTSRLKDNARHEQIAERFLTERVLVGCNLPQSSGPPVKGYQLGHEAIADRWPWMKQWIADHGEQIDLLGRIGTNAKRWEDADRDSKEAFLSPGDFEDLQKICGDDFANFGPKIQERLNIGLGESLIDFIAACAKNAKDQDARHKEEISKTLAPLYIENQELKRTISDTELELDEVERQLSDAKKMIVQRQRELLGQRSATTIVAAIAGGILIAAVAGALIGRSWADSEIMAAFEKGESQAGAVERAKVPIEVAAQVSEIRKTAFSARIPTLNGCWEIVDDAEVPDCYKFELQADEVKSELRRTCNYRNATPTNSKYTVHEAGILTPGRSAKVAGDWEFGALGDYLVWRAKQNGDIYRNVAVAKKVECPPE